MWDVCVALHGARVKGVGEGVRIVGRPLQTRLDVVLRLDDAAAVAVETPVHVGASILVVMDVGLRRVRFGLQGDDLRVSILVVMDVGLRLRPLTNDGFRL